MDRHRGVLRGRHIAACSPDAAAATGMGDSDWIHFDVPGGLVLGPSDHERAGLSPTS